ncbi:MAG: rod shape-determining protein MreC [Acidimicrobiales bacterium]
MKLIAAPRRTRRTLVVVVVLALVSVTLITFDGRSGTHHLTSGLKSVGRDVFSPVVSGVNDVLSPIGHFFAGAVNYGSLQQENQRLEALVGNLRLQIEETQGAAGRDRELAGLAKIPYLGALPTVTAPMINFDLSNFDADIVIGKGRNQGVSVGAPVVAAGGLVGEVVEASHSTAVVQLITDPASSIGVGFGPTQTLYATVQGQGPDKPLLAEYVQQGSPLRIGQVMYTNGLAGAQLPAGIPVGMVRSLHQGIGGGSMTVTLTPLADLDQLAYVDVVQWAPPL